MFRRLNVLYLRYAAVHGGRLGSVALGPFGRRWGQVEQVRRTGGQLHVTGWADAARLRFAWPGGAAGITPDLPRPDVAARRRTGPETGFEVALPAEARPLRVEVLRHDGAYRCIDIPDPADPPTRSAHRRLRRSFLRALLRAAPLFWRYAAARPPEKARLSPAIKRALGLDVATHGSRLEAGWFESPAPPAADAQAVTIVLPIHNALPLLKACLARIDAHTDLPWHLIAVEDASTDPALRPWLRDWAAQRADHVTLILQDENRGFVHSVNAGLAQADARDDGAPVLLLNSDAMLPPGWAPRLLAPLSDAFVASVTPMSNAAEIFSVPAIGPGIALSDGEGDALDRVARGFGPALSADMPTGVGFCMALSAEWLARVPRLDPVFGRGYGEEVDWCQRTRAMGARHLCAPNVFVEHVGGQSFGDAEKTIRIRQANGLIARRYPGYDAEVQRVIAEDPLTTPRLALGIALAAGRVDRLPVYLAHSLGGGAEIALMDEIARHPAAVVLRVGGAARWQVELHVDGVRSAGQTDDLRLVHRLLTPAARLELIYSCGVGDPDPVELPQALLSLRRPGRGDRIALRIHDYFPLSPSYTLLSDAGVFAGVPAPSDPDPVHVTTRPDGAPVPLARWRRAWGALISAAEEVTVFSAAAADIVRAAYPDARLRLRPHDLPAVPRPVAPSSGAGSIGVLGNLNLQKGALVLRRIAQTNPGTRFVVIGNVDCRIALPGNVTVHGSYATDQIAPLAERYRVQGWLMPSVWPETFSFATHEALATGLVVAGFSLGGQGEALDRAENGLTVPLDPHETAPARLHDALRDRMVQAQVAQRTAAE